MNRYYHLIIILISSLTVSITLEAGQAEPERQFLHHHNSQWHLDTGWLKLHFQDVHLADWLLHTTLTSLLLPPIRTIPGHLSLFGLSHNIRALESASWLLQQAGDSAVVCYGAYQLFSLLDKIYNDLVNLGETLWTEATKEPSALKTVNNTQLFLQDISRQAPPKQLEINRDTEGNLHLHFPDYYHPRLLVLAMQLLPIQVIEKKAHDWSSGFGPWNLGNYLANQALYYHASHVLHSPRNNPISWVTPRGIQVHLFPFSKSNTGETSLVRSNNPSFPITSNAISLPVHPPQEQLPTLSMLMMNTGGTNGKSSQRTDSGKSSQKKSVYLPQVGSSRSGYLTGAGGGGGEPPRRPTDYSRKPAADSPVREFTHTPHSEASTEAHMLATLRYYQYQNEQLHELINKGALDGRIITGEKPTSIPLGDEILSAMDRYGICFRLEGDLKASQHPFDHPITVQDVTQIKKEILALWNMPPELAGTLPPYISTDNSWALLSPGYFTYGLEKIYDFLRLAVGYGSTRAVYFFAGLKLNEFMYYEQQLTPGFQQTLIELKTRYLLEALHMLAGGTHVRPIQASQQQSESGAAPPTQASATGKGSVLQMVSSELAPPEKRPVRIMTVQELEAEMISNPEPLIPLDETSLKSFDTLAKVVKHSISDGQPQIIVYGSHAQRAQMYSLYSTHGQIYPRDWDFKIHPKAVFPILKSLADFDPKGKQLDELFSTRHEIEINQTDQDVLIIKFLPKNAMGAAYWSFKVTLFHRSKDAPFSIKLAMDFSVVETLPTATL